MRPFDFVRPRKEYIEKRTSGLKLRFISIGSTVKEEDSRMKTEKKLKAVGIITETCGRSASVHWIGNDYGLHCAWWSEDELEVIDNLPRVLANATAHPFGRNTKQGDEFFPVEKAKKEN